MNDMSIEKFAALVDARLEHEEREAKEASERVSYHEVSRAYWNGRGVGMRVALSHLRQELHTYIQNKEN